MVAPFAGTAPAVTMLEVFKSLYRIPQDINVFIDEHISQLKMSENLNTQVMGKVLEGSKNGFGIGFITPVALIAAGQLLLGNPLTVPIVIVTAPFNPIVMTSAALGALYFGWNSLSNSEKSTLLDNLSQGLQVGEELIRSIITFAVEKMEQFLNCDAVKDIKEWITSTIDTFGTWCSETCDDACQAASDLIEKSRNFFSGIFSSKPENAETSENPRSETGDGR